MIKLKTKGYNQTKTQILQETCKKSRKYYLCKTSPTLVFTNVNGKELVPEIHWSKERIFAKKLKAHTFSQSWKALFMHFQSQVKIENCNQSEQFNSRQVNAQKLNDDRKQELKTRNKAPLSVQYLEHIKF
ncbi:hypothetical protein RFI_28983 [Reticulomyxa filosa]|uniref:Uncharacterized protein n=1 Tax=Reticulomyxa filosa TaxID=46433 RepID=X6M368_RETFI|nr:hypothetical protein RFI_28983 [Reticulomyxa filosa]|eukprot:ETO08403.1 hypothetical protein RFI_28983 [Reticulomyxa filosa]